MRKLIAFTVAQIMSVSAMAGPLSQFMCIAKPGEIKNAVKGAFVRVETREGLRGVTAKYIASNGKVIAEHQIVRRTPKQMLLEYAPSKVRANLNAQALKSKLATAGKVTGDAILRFPEEATAFFFAIGAVTYGQMALDYNANPIAISQYLNSQKDPIAHVAFLNFMVANGLASHAMMQAFTNPSFRPFIPYLGMSIGMTASNITHELAYIPHIKECIASLKAGKEDPSCDKAYSSWVDYGYEKMHEYAPTFASMWASTLLSGMISQCLSAAVQWTATQVVKFIGVQVALTLTPAGWVGRGAQFLIKVGQLGLFVGLDMLINPYITTPYRTVTSSYDLAKVEDSLFMALKEHKAYGWEKPTEHNLDKTLDKLDVEMTQWRALNMQKVQMAHANWIEYLSKFSHQYQAAQQYYRHFTNEIWEKYYGRYANSDYKRVIDRPMFLNGIKPNNFNENELSAFVESPGEIESKQLETVALVVQQMKAMVQSEKVRRHLKDSDIVIFNEIRSHLSQKEPEKIGKGLYLLNAITGIQDCQTGPCDAWLKKYQDASPNLRAILKVVRERLGNPAPLASPGQGYGIALKLHPELSTTLSTFPFPGRDKQQFGAIVTPDTPSYLTASMMWGPDTSRNLIVEKHGFSTEFIPPRISVNNRFDTNAAYDWGIPGPWNSVYSVQIGERNKNRPDQFKSSGKTVFGSLVSGNILPQILDKKGNGFNAWWSANVEPQFLNAWLKYEKQYQVIVSDLVEQLWKSEDHFFNGSGMRTGAMYSLFQERQLALMILGEIVKDTYPTYPEFLSPMKNEPVKEASGLGGKNGITRIAVALGDGAAPNLFAKIAVNRSLEFDALTAPTLIEQGSSPKIDGRNFEFQNQIWSAFGNLTNLVKKIKPIEITRQGQTYKVTETTVSNKEIDDAVAAVKGNIEASKLLFQTLEPGSFKAKIAEKALKTLERNVDEIGVTAKIANAVSYVSNFAGEAAGKPVNMRCQTTSKVQLNQVVQRMLQADCEPYELKAAQAQ